MVRCSLPHVIGVVVLTLLMPLALPVGAASSYASPAFQQQWRQDESVIPNFWGPLATAHNGQQEPYAEAPGGQRLVQYFDKGRMELTNGTVTSGLLAREMVRGLIQTGDASFQAQLPPPSRSPVTRTTPAQRTPRSERMAGGC